MSAKPVSAGFMEGEGGRILAPNGTVVLQINPKLALSEAVLLMELLLETLNNWDFAKQQEPHE